ncbi:MAG: GSU2403 family nucleotidyltransferase fold protein [Xanthobacteraceae bacterium]
MPITPRREALATLAVATEPEGRSLLDVLQRADPTFSAQMGLDPRDPPKRFRSAAGFEVDVITRYRRRSDEERAVRIPGLKCAAQPLRYLEFLIADPIMAVALYGSGVPVTIPQPARYAVHKLVVAQVRSDMSTKRSKDLAQARELIDALRVSDPDAVADALADARRRGTRWKAHVDRSLRDLGLDDAHLL